MSLSQATIDWQEPGRRYTPEIPSERSRRRFLQYPEFLTSYDWAPTLRTQGAFVQFCTGEGAPQKGGGRRGPITGFSARARREFQKLLSRIDYEELQRRRLAKSRLFHALGDCYGGKRGWSGYYHALGKQWARNAGLFITLTFPPSVPDGDGGRRWLWFQPPQFYHDCVNRFLDQWRRDWPDQPAVWRIEWFNKEGFYDPHVHLLTWGGWIPSGWLWREWAHCSTAGTFIRTKDQGDVWNWHDLESIPDGDLHFGARVDVEPIEHESLARVYVTKYVSKMAETATVGRKPVYVEVDGLTDAAAVREANPRGAVLVSSSAQTSEIFSLGSQWGVVNRDHLPMCPVKAYCFQDEFQGLGIAERVRLVMKVRRTFVRLVEARRKRYSGDEGWQKRRRYRLARSHSSPAFSVFLPDAGLDLTAIAETVARDVVVDAWTARYGPQVRGFDGRLVGPRGGLTK